jgi:type IV pilus assembly protein PilQ
MRLKQLLGVVLLVLAGCTIAAAAASQLTGVNVTSHGDLTTVTVRANGNFTHNEYRPTDELLLVDMAGVSPASFANAAKDVHLPGIASYHVNAYKGVNGTEVTRLELMLTPGAAVHVSDVEGGVSVNVSGKSNALAAVAAPPAATSAVPEAVHATPSVAMPSGRAVNVRNVSVARGHDGVDVEITGSGVLTAKAMKLTSPDRIVVDLLNAVPMGASKHIAVNASGIKEIRVARYQVQPPITRVVVDLESSHDYELVPSGSRVTLKFPKSASVSAPATPKPAPAVVPQVVAQNTPPAMVTPVAANPAPAVAAAKLPANDYVVVEPKYEPKGGAAAEPAAAPAMQPASAQAAAHFNVNDPPEFSTYGTSAALAKSAMPQGQPGGMTSTPRRPRYSGEPISVNLKDVDLKDFFRLIHDISGLNVILDPNVRGSLTLVLDDVPWDQALDIVLQNNGLDKQLVGNVLRIATIGALTQEAAAAAAKDKAQALAVPTTTYTHYLSYAHAAEVLPTVQKFMSERGTIIADTRLNGLMIQDIPSVIPRIQQLLTQLDRKTQEVEIEARVVSAGRSFARDIGTQLGFGWGNGPTAVGGNGSAGISPLSVVQPAGAAPPKFLLNGSAIPLFSNFPAGATSGLSFVNSTSDYRLDFILSLAEARGLAKVLSRPRIVTQNNGQAVIKQGSQIPTVTPAQLGGPPSVTYTAAFLNLTVTPQITEEGTIFLNVNVENTSPDFTNAVGGNPTLNTQQALTNVLVKDGGTVVIGGVIQTVNAVNVQQVPLLGSIPILGNLFKRTHVTTNTQELIFFITPRIIQT